MCLGEIELHPQKLSSILGSTMNIQSYIIGGPI
jgi:hypothetical protein